MKQTLLEITQEILNDISGDSVDSISDTVEATQVASIIKSTYNYLISQKGLPEHKSIFQLDETSSTTPAVMTIPDDVLSVETISYDVKADPGAFSGGVFSGSAFDITESSLWRQLTYLTPEEFLRYTGGLKWDNDTVEAYVFTGSKDTHDIKYNTDRGPTFYTILEDYYVLFDAIDTNVTVNYAEASLTLCYGIIEPTFTFSDNFTPNLDETEFAWLIEEAKKAASVKLRQVRDPIAEERARRSWIRLNNQAENVKTGLAYNKIKKYGRRK